MAQPAIRPVDEPVAAEERTITDEQWDAMIRESAAQVRELTDEEAHAIFDARTRQVVGLSREEFLTRYDAGEFNDMPDDAEHLDFWWLVMSLPLGR